MSIIDWWGPPCEIQTTSVWVAASAKAQVHRLSVLAWQAFAAVAETYRYRPEQDQTGGYNCRPVRGTTDTPSTHAVGASIDLNWRNNPQFGTAHDYPDGMVGSLEGIKTRSGLCVFEWGGRWRRIDVMHWQLAVHPNELDIDVSTVPASLEVTSMGATGERVELIQQIVTVPVTGSYDQPTAAGVAVLQRQLEVPDDGVWGPITDAAVRRVFRSLPEQPDVVPIDIAPPPPDGIEGVPESSGPFEVSLCGGIDDAIAAHEARYHRGEIA